MEYFKTEKPLRYYAVGRNNICVIGTEIIVNFVIPPRAVPCSKEEFTTALFAAIK